MSKIKKPTPASGKLTIEPRLTNRQAILELKKSLKLKDSNDSGDLSELAKLVYAADVLINSRPNFVFNDYFFFYCKPFGIEVKTAQAFFEKFVSYMLKIGKIEEANGLDGVHYIII